MKVSIIIITYNRLIYFKQSLESVLNQTYKNKEIIILNNGSTDDTKEYIKGFNNIKYFENQNNDHTSKRYNDMIKISEGDIIFFLADDDYLFDNDIIEKVMNKFINNNCLEVFYGNAISISAQGTKIDIFPFESANPVRVWRKEYIHFGTMFFKKSIFSRIGYFNEKLIYYSDYEIKARCLFECSCYGENIPIIYYRRHSGQDSNEMTQTIRNNESIQMMKDLKERYRVPYE